MVLSEKLFKLRKKSGLSQEQLAEQLNVSRQAISKWESGASIPETEKLITISNYFNVSLDYLMKDKVEEISSENTGDESSNGRIKCIAGFSVCIAGIVCLILWGLSSIFNPSLSNQISESSMISIDGNGVFLILCIVAIVVGAGLLLKNKK